MAANPSFAVTPRIGAVALAAADTAYTAPTSTATVITGAATGTRIAEVVVQMRGTTVATMVRLFLFDGTTHFLFDEIPIVAATGSQAVRQARASVVYNNLILPSSSWSLRATVHSSHAGNVTALGADL